MEARNGLSTDMKSLVDIIRQQAKEYGEAFEAFHQEKAVFESLRSEYEVIIEKIRREYDKHLSFLKDGIHDEIGVLQYKTERIERIYQELDSISKFNERLGDLYKNLKNGSIELESHFARIKSNLELEIESLSIGLKSRMEKEMEAINSKVELRLSIKSKQIEGRVVSIEEQTSKLTENQNKQFADFSDEIDIIKEKFHELQVSNLELRQEILKKVLNINKDISEHLGPLDAIIEEFSRQKEIIQPEFFVGREIFENQLGYLNRQIEDMEKRLRTVSIKRTGFNAAMIILTLISLATAFLAIFSKSSPPIP
jgi:hypothetical protein